MLVSDLVIFAVIGSISGIFAGSLGIGGGLIVVPALNLYFDAAGVYEDPYLMASSTSLFIMVFTTLSGTLSHIRYKTINLALIPYMLIGSITGSIFGRCLLLYLSHNDKNISSLTFLLLVFWVGYRLLKDIKNSFVTKNEDVNYNKLMYVIFIISAIGSWHGIGVGSLLVPWLLVRGIDQKNATAVSTVCNFILALSATAFILIYKQHISYGSILSVISLEAVATIGVVSFITAPIGVALTRKIQPRIFKLVMLCFIFSLALQQITTFYNCR